ncbi:MAG: hypothetical protein ACFFBP_15270 [Promethearchaeota archaeon]
MVKKNGIEKEIYICTIRNKWITSDATNIDDFIKTYQFLAEKMRNWKKLGIKLDPESGIGDDYAEFFTSNKDVAIKANFIYFDSKGNKFLQTRSGKEVPI